MKFDIETWETRTYLVHYRIQAPSLRAALEQVYDKHVDEIQRTRIEDGDAVSGIEYVYFLSPVTWYGALIKSDDGIACVVEIELDALVEEIASRLKELAAVGQVVTDIRIGHLQAQSLSECRQRVTERQMVALSGAELRRVTEQLGEAYANVISSCGEPVNGRVEVLRE